MKYTRYDLRRKNDNKTFVVIILLIFVLAFVFGTAIFKLLMRNTSNSNAGTTNSNNISDSKVNTKVSDNISNDKVIKFIVVQGGIYQNKENAEEERSLLTQYGTPFDVTEDNKTRVFLGIYIENQGEQIMKSLTEQKIDNSKMIFTINKNDLCDAEIAEIINANLQILNKLGEKNVKAVQTEELKKWCSSLKKVDKDSKNAAVLNDIKEHVNKMPKEVSKDKAAENYAYIYSVLKKMNSK